MDIPKKHKKNVVKVKSDPDELQFDMSKVIDQKSSLKMEDIFDDKGKSYEHMSNISQRRKARVKKQIQEKKSKSKSKKSN